MTTITRLHPSLNPQSPECRARYFGLRNKRDAAMRWLGGNVRAMTNRVTFCGRIVRRQIEAIERDIGA